MKSTVVFGQDQLLQNIGTGISRRVLSYVPQQMIVEVHFEKGAQGALHQHPHTQSTYIISGEFVFTVGDQAYTLKSGDSLSFASGERHGCQCLEKGVVLDIFTPCREDFLKES